MLFLHLPPSFSLVSSICAAFALSTVLVATPDLSFDRVRGIMVVGMLLMCDEQSWNILVVMYLSRCVDMFLLLVMFFFT